MLETENLIVLTALGVAAWLWADATRAREGALRQARRLCERVDAQLLDETVAMSRLSVGRGPTGWPVLRRVYRFEFSLAGHERRGGWVRLHGRQVFGAALELPEGTVLEE
jgi:hypothetical protein